MTHFRHVGREEGIDKLFHERDLTLLAFSMDSVAFDMASAADRSIQKYQISLRLFSVGSPIASIPMSLSDYNGRPFALDLIAQAGREDLMFQFMNAFEAIIPKRCTPISLLKEKKADLTSHL